MLDKFTRRGARKEDFDFALTLYLESTKPLLIALGRWDEDTIHERFAQGFNPPQIEVFAAGGADIGWLQVSETTEEFHIDQIHLANHARNKGLGTHLVREVQDRAKAAGKAVALNVIRGNRARRLYERLGFHVVEDGEEKIRMVWRNEEAGSGQPVR